MSHICEMPATLPEAAAIWSCRVLSTFRSGRMVATRVQEIGCTAKHGQLLTTLTLLASHAPPPRAVVVLRAVGAEACRPACSCRCTCRLIQLLQVALLQCCRTTMATAPMRAGPKTLPCSQSHCVFSCGLKILLVNQQSSH